MENKSEQISVKIEKPVFGGLFLSRLPDKKPVFIPYVLPDEQVGIRIVQDKKGYSRAIPISIQQPSPKRIPPPCQYFTKCGGCHYQHLSYPDQLAIKDQIVREQIARIQGIDSEVIKNIIPSEEIFHYRNNVIFSIDSQGKLGFQAFSSNNIIPIEECLLLNEQISQIRNSLDLEQIPGLTRVHIRSGISDETLLILESKNYQELPILDLEVPLSVIHSSDAGNLVLAGEDHLLIQVKDRVFRVSADSFFQVNTSQANKMVDLVRPYVPQKGKQLLELYSGVGLFTRFLADRFEEIYAVEESTSACDDFAINLDSFDHINLYVGPVNEIVPQLSIHPDVILVDPPRAGVDPKTMNAILELKAAKIIYVSCDIATLTRDLKILLEQGYTLEELTPIDMFPQTFHVETVVLMSRK